MASTKTKPAPVDTKVKSPPIDGMVGQGQLKGPPYNDKRSRQAVRRAEAASEAWLRDHPGEPLPKHYMPVRRPIGPLLKAWTESELKKYYSELRQSAAE
jgi:hypothetical protein